MYLLYEYIFNQVRKQICEISWNSGCSELGKDGRELLGTDKILYLDLSAGYGDIIKLKKKLSNSTL